MERKGTINFLLVKVQTSVPTMESSVGILQEATKKISLPYDPPKALLSVYSMDSMMLQRYLLIRVHCLSLHNIQERNNLNVYQLMDNKNLAYVCNEIFSAVLRKIKL